LWGLGAPPPIAGSSEAGDLVVDVALHWWGIWVQAMDGADPVGPILDNVLGFAQESIESTGNSWPKAPAVACSFSVKSYVTNSTGKYAYMHAKPAPRVVSEL
jgi:hypothetical protein